MAKNNVPKTKITHEVAKAAGLTDKELGTLVGTRVVAGSAYGTAYEQADVEKLLKAKNQAKIKS